MARSAEMILSCYSPLLSKFNRCSPLGATRLFIQQKLSAVNKLGYFAGSMAKSLDLQKPGVAHFLDESF